MNRKRTLQKGWRSLSKDGKSDLKRSLQILGATVIILLLLYYVGINGLTYIGGFWSAFTGEQGSTRGDTIAPPPPTFAPLSPYTRSKTIKINGYAEPAAEINISVNGKQAKKTITEAGGTFSFSNINLPKEGKNIITAIATDQAGNKSQKSAELVAVLDSQPPKLEISKPQDGQTFTSGDDPIRIRGKTEPGITVKVNNIQATVLADGVFKATITPTEPGQIKIVIVVTDKAGNEEKTELTVNYEPGS